MEDNNVYHVYYTNERRHEKSKQYKFNDMLRRRIEGNKNIKKGIFNRHKFYGDILEIDDHQYHISKLAGVSQDYFVTLSSL